jgi:hypothetical protein
MSLGLFNCRLIQPAGDQLFFFAGVKWTPWSRPFWARNKLMLGGVLGLRLGAAMEARPLPFRPLNRRSGRIPAEPYPPFKSLQCRTDILA